MVQAQGAEVRGCFAAALCAPQAACLRPLCVAGGCCRRTSLMRSPRPIRFGGCKQSGTKVRPRAFCTVCPCKDAVSLAHVLCREASRCWPG